MSVPGSASPLFLAAAAAAAAPAGYQIDRSLRFNDDDGANLSKTLSAGNRKTWTWSGWLKRGNLGSVQWIYAARTSGSFNPYSYFYWNSDDSFTFVDQDSSGGRQATFKSSRRFRDCSAWYHIVVVWDTTNSTQTDRIKFYANGQRLVDNQLTWVYPDLNDLSNINAAVPHGIGAEGNYATGYTLDGYLAEVHFVDGQALAATDFGEEDSNGVWQPKEYSGTYGGKHNGDWVGDTTGSGYNSSHTADKAFDGSTTTSAAPSSGGTMTFTPSTAITGITKVRIYAQRDNSASSATMTLNGTDISSNWSNGDDKTVEITTNNLTSLAWTTQSNGQWFAVRKIEIYYSGAYYTLLGPSNSFYLKFADNSSNSALGTDSSGNNNTWTVNNLSATGLATPTATVVGNPTSSTDNPFGVGQGYSVDFDGDDEIRFTGPGTVTGDLTVECFYKMTSADGFDRIFSTKEDSYSSEQTIIRRHSNGNVQFYFGNGTPEQQSSSTISANTWYHAAIVYDRSASTVSYYLDGSRVGTDSYSNDVPITQMVVAGGYGSENFNGKVSNARITKQALYSGTSYTVPTSTLTTTSQGATASNVALLCCHQSSTTAVEGGSSASSDIDSLIDTPTNYTPGSGNAGGNYCTWNPLDVKTTIALSNGNLDLVGSTDGRTRGTLGMPSGKFYWEITVGSAAGNHIGIWATNIALTNDSYRVIYLNGGVTVIGGSLGTTFNSYTNGDVIGIAFNAATRQAQFFKNGTSEGTLTAPALPAGSVYTPACIMAGTNSSNSANFGARQFAYTPPTGYVSLCTENLSESAYASIPDGSKVFDVSEWVGNQSNRSISLGFSPDFVWIKAASNGFNHQLFDIIRGANKTIHSNGTSLESTANNSLTSFNSDGFSLGTDNNGDVNGGGPTTYYAWAWDGGTSTASNTDGSITSSVRGSASNGFSIVSFTADGTAGDTVGHGLNAKPEFIIYKDLEYAQNWGAYHASLGATYGFNFNSPDARYDDNGYFNDTEPTSSVITFGNYVGYFGTHEIIAYCFASVEGFSSFGSYQGNGSSSGPFVYTGHRARFLMIKCATKSGEDWLMLDTKRDPYNDGDSSAFYSSQSHGSNSTSTITTDILSNGFKARATNAAINESGQTYIYMSFASHPFRTARAR